ncbi:hypothetical protein SAMN02745121_00436 [Nannocystis exedens]|uniref:Uncharacterized protein n=1 Tax=Nannocystis exedens TaxID=54 RepID=A0A1I1T1S2_9BACT|nr:hypothetical protein [Nannocystis exedens]PCC66835.1 hypothetical protein NAEX_09431 [Nannocystis exedens]SFD52644.1 hypothetical protein SAMN02745121_00436 [Nannocystis exedens]
MSSWVARLVPFAALALSACIGAEPPPADGVFVGRAGDIWVAVVAEDDVVAAYACDGTGDKATLGTWFYGQLDRGVGSVAGAGDARLVLDLSDDAFAGALELGGVERDVTGERVEGDDLGLFWGEADGWVGGWIFAVDGDQRGAVLERDTGDVSALLLPTAGEQTLTLVDGTPLPVTRMAAPRDLR